MFGYVTVYSDELKIIEQRNYRSVYCGLCKQLSKSFGQLSRLSLSYDFAFLSLLEISLTDDPLEVKNEACIANPFRKKPILKNNSSLVFSANTAMLMVYYKVIDNIADSGFFKKIGYYLLLPFASFARKKAKKTLPLVDLEIKKMMDHQFVVEKTMTKSLDEASLPSSKALGYICGQLAKSKEDEKVFEYFGRNLGRWVYIMDAVDDYFSDIKGSSFNVFVNKYGADLTSEELKDLALADLDLARSEIINAYHLIKIKRNKNLMNNIVFLGLKDRQYKILNKEADKKP